MRVVGELYTLAKDKSKSKDYLIVGSHNGKSARSKCNFALCSSEWKQIGHMTAPDQCKNTYKTSSGWRSNRRAFSESVPLVAKDDPLKICSL